MTKRGVRYTLALAAIAVALVAVIGAAGAFAGDLYVPPPPPAALEQVTDLGSAGDTEDAHLIRAMIEQPRAAWFVGRTPRRTRLAVKRTTERAEHRGEIPVLVAYNIPFRDCSQLSAGGAKGTQEYLAWIRGFARGIGDRPAIVILEPDGLGIIPWYTDINGNLEWCRPAEADPEAAAADRFVQLNFAVDRLNAQPNVDVYLDGTHSGWLGVGDAADRLVKAGVERAAGLFLNVSNYRLTEHLVKYGTWISSCIAFASNPEEGGWRLGDYESCASQYQPADPNDFGTWHLTDQWYEENLGTAEPTTHFVIDTSRNGRGPWTPPAGVYPDPQDWCNPPGRGVGARPRFKTRMPLVDAYLWVKVPGESDGECTRGLGPAGETVDPEWGRIDPPAGAWFPEQALELARRAVPSL
jgi:endoglucanase